jgi:NTE family protein
MEQVGRYELRLALRSAWVAALSCLVLAACSPSTDVPPPELPHFVEPAGPPPRVALVLGSGGPRGFAHIGVLKVLDEAGIHPDLVVGSSVGALVGALYASGIGASDLERIAYGINLIDFFEVRTLVGGTATGSAIQAYVDERVAGRPIEQLRIPFVAAATRVRDGHLVLFNRGDTGLAVRASGASPGQFEPVRVGADWYVDGDEASPVPIRAARKLGAKVVIAVDVSAYVADTPPGVPQDWIAKDARRAKQVASEAPAADVLIHPDIGYYAGHDEAYRHRVIAIAERVTREALPRIRAALARASGPMPQNLSTARMPAGVASR